MKKVAIVVIDMLNDFVTGALKCERAQAIVDNIKALTDSARKQEVPVIFVNDAHLKKIDHEFILWGEHALKGSEGAQVIPELKVSEKDYVVEKRRYSGFFKTDLDLLLNELQVDTVIFTGIHTHICVQHTVADAYYLGYDLYVAADGVTAFTADAHQTSIKFMEANYGVKVLSTKDLIAKFID